MPASKAATGSFKPAARKAAIFSAAVPLPPLAAGALDKNAAHGLRRGSEEVAPAVPPVRLAPADEPQIGLVDQGGRLQGVAGLFVREPGGGQAAQLLVHSGEQVGGRP